MSNATRGEGGPDGVVLVDKPSGLTSHDVVSRLRRVFDTSRVGHAGTLDPLATGLLVVALGRATRLLRFAQVEIKRYRARVKFGRATSSLDADGEVVASTDDVTRTLEQLQEAAATFLGASQQRPPMVSALKVGGKRLHELARAGVEVEREPREIVVSRFDVSSTDAPDEWDLDVVCSTGTYVRVLASELAERLGTLGHLVALRRLASGPLDVNDAVALDVLANSEAPEEWLRPPRDLVASLTAIELDDAQVVAMRRGQRLSVNLQGPGPLAAFSPVGELVGVLSARGALWQPDVVLSGAPS